MTNDNSNALAWSLYWAQDRLHSCVAANPQQDQEVLDSIWAVLANDLPQRAQVLDLATGNGAVPLAMLGAREDLAITAVDQADIDPVKHISHQPALARVNFQGKVDLNQLQLTEGPFDAITSQFGIEYAGLESASKQAIPHLKQDGHLVLLIHHDQSEVIKSSGLKLAEMQTLLSDDGLIDTLLHVVRGEVPFAELESKGQEFLASEKPMTQQISGQVFAGIDRIASQLSSDIDGANALAATLKLRLQAEHDRLQQMQGAAQSEQQMADFKSHLQDLGITISSQKEMFVDHDEKPYLLAWLVNGIRTSQPNK